MKHSLKVTLILLILFLLAQIVGLGVIYKYIDQGKTSETGEVQFRSLPIGDRPEFEEDTSYIPLMLALVVGTVIMLFLLKKRLTWVTRIWFATAVVMALIVSFGAYISVQLAVVFALLFGIWKVFKPNFWVHNATEVFLYGGLAAIFVPVFNLISVSIFLVLIAIYDAYAVWKSKHMVTLAQEQKKSKMFAGLLVPYSLPSLRKKKQDVNKVNSLQSTQKVATRSAVLGGGDIGFPLIFAGVVMKEIGLWQSLLIPLFALGGLALLLYIGKKDRYYPAMPFIGGACFVGLGVVWVLQFLF